jgi:hypothetical protein
MSVGLVSVAEDLTDGGHCCCERSSCRPFPLSQVTSEVVGADCCGSEAVREYSDANLVVEPPLFRR